MYYCECCGKLAVPKELMFRNVVSKRDVVYSKVKKQHTASCAKKKRRGNKCDCAGPYIDTYGWEITKEEALCGGCYHT
jgi:hypothetical protein